MNKLEDFMNALTDMDWGWWPVVSLRPKKHEDIDNRVLLQISPIFGSVLGLILLYLREIRHGATFDLVVLFAYLLFGVITFFILYKVTFAYFWNRRAERLRTKKSGGKHVA